MGARATLASDRVVDMDYQHVPFFIQRLHGAFYLSREAIFDAIQHRTSFNLVHLATVFKEDIFIPKQRPFDQVQFANRALQIIAPLMSPVPRILF
jgi:hypothetical protein